MPTTPFFTQEGDDMMHDQTPLHMINLIDQILFFLCHFSKRKILFYTKLFINECNNFVDDDSDFFLFSG